ncbi:inhibitor of vertebrate lysozyme [Yersinia enterocolitica]|nr:inhibitor of vertebrate lysozyme [Yersinia enterocolitica]
MKGHKTLHCLVTATILSASSWAFAQPATNVALVSASSTPASSAPVPGLSRNLRQMLL